MPSGFRRHLVGKTLRNVCQMFTHKMAAKASWRRNYVTVTLCISIGASVL